MAKKILVICFLMLALVGPPLFQPLAELAVNYYEKAGINGEGMVLLGLAYGFLYYFLLDLVPMLLSFTLWKLSWPLGKKVAAIVAFLAFIGAESYAYFLGGETPPWFLTLAIWFWSFALVMVITMADYKPPLTVLFLMPLSLATMEWLRFWPLWPQGQLAYALAEVSSFLGDATAISLILVSLSILTALLTIVATQLQAMYYHSYKAAVQSGEERLRWLELRNLQEMHTLVHDLKTPLTTIAGLNSLVGLLTVQEQIREYSEKIAQAVDNASAMVSEILAEAKRTRISVGDLVNYIRAHVLPRYTGQTVIFDIQGAERELAINHIRITRALINILENAFEATAHQPDARIKFSTRGHDGWVEFIIEDNGPGMEPEQLEKIWEWGFSTKKQPSGLGLFFVKQVITQHQGKIEISSTRGQGTRIKILLPEEREGGSLLGQNPNYR